MHYPKNAFAIDNSVAVITPLIGNPAIGQTRGFSDVSNSHYFPSASIYNSVSNLTTVGRAESQQIVQLLNIPLFRIKEIDRQNDKNSISFVAYCCRYFQNFKFYSKLFKPKISFTGFTIFALLFWWQGLQLENWWKSACNMLSIFQYIAAVAKMSLIRREF